MNPIRLAVRAVLLTAILLIGAAAEPVWCAGLPKKGQTLPAFDLPPPASDKARDYLGIRHERFRLAEIPCRLLLLEVIGVYCPQCYQQAPLFNTLFNRIETGKLKGQVKMLALAAGGNETEITYLYEQVRYSFPIVADPNFEVHKLLGEPRTPFTLLLDPSGKVLHTHMGVVENIDAFLKLINELVR